VSDAAIRVRGLAKEYTIGQLGGMRYDTLRDQLAALARGRRRDRSDRKVWALSDVSFEVSPGEVMGIIGRNGAGKTTLLRILSRITEPTRGTAEFRGRVGSLLEVGAGFHPELTGRENIFLNGSILGMKRSETTVKLDQIVDFAGVETYLDTPVKRYSSGMYVRLAFAVAAHLEPEILLIDEVLAVGDAEFQKKCLGKVESIGRSGRTVVFVSHTMPTILRLCDRTILLSRGTVAADGPSQEVVAQYLVSEEGAISARSWSDETAPGGLVARLRSVRVIDERGEGVETVDVRRPVGIEICWHTVVDGEVMRPQIMVANEQGVHAFNAMDTSASWLEPCMAGEYRATAWIPGNLLNEGRMTVSVFVSTLAPEKTIHHAAERDAVSFQVLDPVEGDSAKGVFVGQWHGAVRPLLDWDVERVAR
jgi:lipopolysaccharide transport system ATP-binding protein